ncbi:hypothetical protein [Actinoplanes philippinensis]|uniref:hypothetical protein n=1 Tax=Actinoplanes philippinensis TaxID=35752 RepID=UPI0011601E45|nr:hypothetical protein [Actinoplanes philippinensis]
MDHRSPPAVTPARPRPLWSRKGILTAWFLAAGVLVAGTVLKPWFSTRIDVQATLPGGTPIGESAGSQVGVLDLRPWGPLFLAAAALLAVVAPAAHITGRPRWRRGLALAGLAAGAVTAACLIMASSRFDEAAAEGIGRWADLTRRLMPDGPKRWEFVDLALDRTGWTAAVLATLVLALVAAGALWPGRGARVAAVAGVLVAAGSLAPPWVIGHGVTAAEVREWQGHWPLLAPATGWPAMAALVLLIALVTVALRRSSTGGRLAIMLVSVLLAVGVSIGATLADLDPEVWVPAADRAATINIDRQVSPAPTVFALLAGPLLGTAAVLAWHSARRRGRSATMPSHGDQ